MNAFGGGKGKKERDLGSEKIDKLSTEDCSDVGKYFA
jgi:hypothetical protein